MCMELALQLSPPDGIRIVELNSDSMEQRLKVCGGGGEMASSGNIEIQPPTHC
jgi:hypothetical protein